MNGSTNGKTDNEKNNIFLTKKRDREESNDKNQHQHCPYLSTIKRHVLDFDFEKNCSISNSKLNIYACLVCGKYLQGRGKGTHAYLHSLEKEHYLFICLSTDLIYCLPDNYEVQDKSLEDIKRNLRPRYSKIDVDKLDQSPNYSYALDGQKYLQGCIGLNNIKCTDYANVIIQSLFKIKRIRDFFLFFNKKIENKYDLIGIFLSRFSELFRKIMSPDNFKNHVSPHEVLQSLILASKGRFKITEQTDCIKFLTWFLNTVHSYLKDRHEKSIISDTFQGELEIEILSEAKGLEDKPYIIKDNKEIVNINGLLYYLEKKKQKFFFLTLELPKPPLFRESTDNIVIPQVSIFSLIEKFTSQKLKQDNDKFIRYRITKMPENLILYYKRFENNMFFIEKNNTIINFPLKNFSLASNSDDTQITKSYNLVSNIIHDGKPGDGQFRVQVKKHPSLEEWVEIQDLTVSDILPQSVVVSESYIHFYEGNTNKPDQ